MRNNRDELIRIFSKPSRVAKLKELMEKYPVRKKSTRSKQDNENREMKK